MISEPLPVAKQKITGCLRRKLETDMIYSKQYITSTSRSTKSSIRARSDTVPILWHVCSDHYNKLVL